RTRRLDDPRQQQVEDLVTLVTMVMVNPARRMPAHTRCPAAKRCCALTLSASTATLLCAEPIWSILSEPRHEKCTICPLSPPRPPSRCAHTPPPIPSTPMIRAHGWLMSAQRTGLNSGHALDSDTSQVNAMTARRLQRT